MSLKNKVRIVDLAASDFEKLTVSNAGGGKGVTAAKIGEGVFITVEAADIRYRIDGTAPDATTGHLLLDGMSLQIIDKTAVTNLLMIRDGGSDATIQVTHY
jgi:hypothetical protein